MNDDFNALVQKFTHEAWDRIYEDLVVYPKLVAIILSGKPKKYVPGEEIRVPILYKEESHER